MRTETTLPTHTPSPAVEAAQVALITAAHRLNALAEAVPSPHTRAELVAQVGVLARATAVYALLCARSDAVADLGPVLQAQRACAAWHRPGGDR